MNASTSLDRSHLVGLILAIAVVACGEGPTVSGRIFDNRIEIDADRVPTSLWLELENAGTVPCRLMVLDTLDEIDARWDPRDLPVENGQVVINTGAPVTEGVHASEELYVEVDGRPLSPAPGERLGKVIDPGLRARVQLALIGTPREGAVRIVLCDDPGDYERGRYAVLEFGG